MIKEEKTSTWMNMSQHERLLMKGIQSLARDKSISDFVFAESVIELIVQLGYKQQSPNEVKHD